MKVHYLHMGFLPIYVGFTTCPKAFAAEMRRLKIDDPPSFTNDGADATAHTFTKEKIITTIVTIKKDPKRIVAQVVGLLAHEAVHVWQECRSVIREREPSIEFEAYTVQWITQFFVEKYYAKNTSRHG